MDLEKNMYYGILFSYYKNLLTEKQVKYLTNYYEHNFSITEIAQNNCVSKEAIFDTIKRVNLKLIDFENKLELYKKVQTIEKILKKENIDSEIINQVIDII